MSATLNHDDYTIAWIAVLPIEAEAALGVLDKEHEGEFETVRGDDYLYIGGEINGHNVVIATWPAGQNYGVGAAAALVNQVKARFSNIWFALLVGVAAGLPNIYPKPPAERRDIRLGDVLVCVPDKSSTGIIHYDLGKDTEDGFLINGRQAETPAIVRAAFTSIKLRNKKPFKAGNIFDKYLAAFQEKMDEKKFLCPSQEKDILFTTPGDMGSESEPIEREPRDESERTQVWYGNIGSGNSMMRNPQRRDMLRDKHDLIGLEMEAAGIMNTLPTGVIRGVCDYGDSQKNKDWQPYAAAVAAVYAKGILYTIKPKLGPAPTNENASLLLRSSMLIEKCTNNSSQEELFHRISDYDHERVHRRLCRKRLQGIGQWFLEHPKYKEWFDGAGSMSLWCSGIIGSGKTMLATALVDAAQQNSRKSGNATVFYYCENEQRDTLKAFDLLASFLKQLLWYLAIIHNPCPEEVQDQIWKFFGTKRTQPDVDDLADIVISLSEHMANTTYIIDGLDELDEKEAEKLLRVVQKLLGSKTKRNGSRIAIFSRDQITPYLKVLQPDTIQISTSNNIKEDLKFYIESVVENKMCVRELTSNLILLGETKEKLSAGASGMFLWVHLQVEVLWDTCLTDGEIRQAIENLPKTLEETYRRCLSRINRGRNYTAKALKWVRDAVRPLHIDELREAVAFDISDTMWDSDKVPDSASLISCCANLIVQDTTDHCIRFAHPSVRQFLENNQADNNLSYLADPSQVEVSCGEVCVAYLSFSNFSLQIERNSDKILQFMPQNITAIQNLSRVGAFMSTVRKAIAPRSDQPNRSIDMRLPPKSATIANREQFKFLPYAAAHWATQTKKITRQSVVWDLFEQLAVNPNKTWNFHPWISSGQSQASHLHGLLSWAVKEQHIPLLEIVLASGSGKSATNFFDVPVIGGSLSALHVAARLGFEDVVKLLLRVCAVNRVDGEGYTAMHHSAEKGYVEVTRLLANAKGANVEVPTKKGDHTPLSLAAMKGHEQIMSLLIEKRARVEVEDYNGRTPLFWAINNGHEAVVKLLLETGKVKVNIKDSRGKTPLFWATENGHEGIVKLLLETGKVEVDIKDNRGETPLFWATFRGYEAVVKLLLETGKVEVDIKDSLGETPLFRAAEYGHEGIVKLLLETGKVEVDIKTNLGHTPRSIATEHGYEAITKLLQDYIG